MPRWLSKNSVLTSDFPETAVPQTAEPATDQTAFGQLAGCGNQRGPRQFSSLENFEQVTDPNI